MSNHPFVRADRAFRLAGASRLILHRVESAEIELFAEALYDFLNNADGLDESPLWSRIITGLKTIFFNLRSAPIPGNLDAALPEETEDLLLKAVGQIKQTHPDLASRADDLLEATRLVRDSSENPLLEAMVSTVGSRGAGSAIVLKSGKLREQVAAIVEDRFQDGPLPVLTLTELDHDLSRDRLLVPGRPHWFEGSGLFHSPFAPETHVYVFDWYSDRISINPAFEYGQVGKTPAVENPERKKAGDLSDSGEDFEALEPESHWEAIVQGITASEGNVAESGSHPVEARLHILAGDRAVYLQDGAGMATRLQARRDEKPNVERVAVRDLKKGDFILLRTEGAGDLLRQVADELLGEHSETLREHHSEWTENLQRMVERKGMGKIVRHLKEAGASSASPQNVRRWCEGEVIKPDRRTDFECIMDLIGLRKETDRYWEHMRLINSAHHRAGYRIRQKLIEKAEQVDPTALHQQGHLTVELDTREGGSMAAFRIEHIASETTSVSSRKTGRPFTHDHQLSLM